MAKTPTWQRKAGQNPSGGLNEAGRRSLKAAGHDIKRPQPEGGSRRDSFCARMKGMKAKLTSAETANDPDSRINKSLRAWNCHADGGPVWEKDRPKGLGKPQKLTPSEKRSAKASAKAAGRPYPNLVDNMRAARADGGSVRPELGAGGDAVKAALKLAQDIIHSQKKAPKIENLARVADKFVYHSGVKPDIEHMTPYLEPQHGSWIKEVASGAVDDPQEFLESANPLLWMSDKPNWVKSKIGRHLGKPFNQITDDDIRNYGHVALIPRKSYEAENIWKIGSEGLDQGPYSTVSNLRTGEPTKAYNTDIYQQGLEPFGVERNEYISAQPIEPMYHLTGDALLNFLNLTKNRMNGGSVRPEMGAGGDAVKAALKAADDIIRAYHASASKFEKFDNSKIGSGVGAQAYGQGHYLASSDPVARGYLGPSAQYDRMSGAMSPKEEFAFDIATNASDPTTWTIIKPLVEKYGQNISYDEAEKLAEDAIRKRGHMYEVGIHARPEHFLDWDKRLAEQSPFVQQKLTPESLKLLPGGPGGPFNGRRAWVDETGLPLGRATTASEPPSSVFQDSEIAPSIYRQLGRDNPAASTDKLRAAGIAGIKYLDPSYRHLGEGARNYVVFNPDILEIMRRYARGGMTRHGYATDGSVEGDVSYLDTPDFEDSGSVMAKLAPSRPQKSPSEFIKQELAYGDKQLPQYDPEAGKETAMRALEIAKAAGYLTPASPYIAVGDFAKQMLTGEPIGAAMASAFLPGGKYAKMAGAALASQAGPEEAEAGPFTKFLTELAEKYRPHYDPSAMIKGQPKDKWISNVALSRPIEDMAVRTTEHRTLAPEIAIEPESMAGKAMISGFGDKTPAGYVVTHLNDRKLSKPVNVLGGPAFARDTIAQAENAYWASNLSRASALANKGKEAAAKEYEPVFSYITQGPQSQDFSHQMTEMILGQLNPKQMEPDTVKKFDQLMREVEIKKGMPGIPTWPGISSPKLRNWLLTAKEGGAGRDKMAKLMDKSMYLKAPGFADVGVARFATTHPDLMHTPIFSSGHMFSRMDPLGTLITNPKVPHPSYDTMLAAPKGKQGYIGGFEYTLPPELHYYDYLSGQKSGYQKGIRPDLVEKPFTQKTMSLMRETPTVIGTPKWVDMSSEYQDIMRGLYGRRR